MLAVLLAVASTALAATQYGPVGEFGDPGSGDGQFVAPRDVAVESSTGHVFVVDRDNDRIQVFAPNAPADYLTQFGTGTLDDPVGIAIDQGTGAVYVSDAGNGRIVKFDSDGEPTPSFSVDAGFTSPALGSASGEVGAFDVAIAVDPASGDLLVADRANGRVGRYGSDGTFDSSFDGSTSPGGAFTGLLDVAVDSTGDIVVVDSATGSVADVVFGSPSRVERFDSAGAHEQTIGASVPSPGAVATDPDTDEVLVAGNLQSWNNNQPLRIFAFEPNGDAAGDFPLGNQTLYSVVPGVAVDGGTSGRLYVVTDFFLGYGDASVQVFEPIPTAAPDVAPGAATATQTTATLKGQLDPGNLATDYHFEYGLTAAYGSSTPTGSVAAGDSPVPVARSIGGLEPGTTYHYRLVATNAEGTSESADATFATKAESPPEQPPAPTRAFEMVSPPDKNGNDVARTSTRTRAALDGDKVTYVSTGGFADAPGAGKTAQYLSERTASGWTTRGIHPNVLTNEFTLLVAPIFRDFSDDLRWGAVVAPDPSPVPGAPENTHNLFVRDNVANDFRLVTTAAPAGANHAYQPVYAGASDDFSHVVFESTGALTLDAPDDGTTKLYESVAGQLQLVGVMPDGAPAPGGSVAGPGRGTFFSGNTESAVSSDGSRIYFTAGPRYDNGFAAEGQIYLRADGSQTEHVTASQRAVPDPAGPRPALFRGASADGSKALFTSCEKLTDDSTADVGSSPDACASDASNDLYRYDVDADALELLSVDAEPADGDQADVIGVAGNSDDGSYVYFAARGRLVPEAPEGALPRLYLWHDGDVRYVATLSDFDNNSDNVIYEPTLSSRGVRLSADGRHLLFMSSGPDASSDDRRKDAYLYRADQDELRCVSCQAEGPVGSQGATIVQGTADGLAATQIEYDSRALLDDGSRVFFSSDEPLVAHDSNGRFDAYEYDVATDEIRLVSSGQSDTDSFFADAGADGRDVFVLTRERLVGWDRDNNVDLYDVREGGGFPEPPPPGSGACEGDACQGAVPGKPSLAGVGSAGTEGPGNVPSGRRATFAVGALSRGQRAALARGRRVLLRVSVSRAGRVSVAARARVAGRSRIVARGSRLARGAGVVRLSVRLSKPARRQLARSGRLRISLRVRFSGAPAPQARTLKLTTRGAN